MKTSSVLVIVFLKLILYTKTLNSSQCVHTIKSVEYFFNIVFSEFTPNIPVCVCVQMCTNFPTYCYPNGCHKRLDVSKKAEANEMPKVYMKPGKGIDNPVFLIEDQKEHIVDVLERPKGHIYDNKNENDENHEKRDNMTNSINSLVLKYKKVPRLEMKYNLREKIKNSLNKRFNNKIDTEIPKWSRVNFIQNARLTNAIPRYSKVGSRKPSQYLMTLFPDPLPFTKSKPVKKYFQKRENNNENSNDTNIEVVSLYGLNMEALEYDIAESLTENSLVEDNILIKLNTSDDAFLYQTHDSEENIKPSKLLSEHSISNAIKEHNFKNIYNNNSNIKGTENEPIYFESKMNESSIHRNQSLLFKTIQTLSNEIDKHINKSLKLLHRQTESIGDEKNKSPLSNSTNLVSINQVIIANTTSKFNAIANNTTVLKPSVPSTKNTFQGRKNRHRIVKKNMNKNL